MILAAVSGLDISIWVLMFVFAVVCVLMCIVILMQRPKNEGLGAAFGSGTTDQLFGARTTNVLQKATVYMATAFFILVLAISILVNKRPKGPTLIAAPAPVVAPADVKPVIAPDGNIVPADTAPKSTEDKPLEPETTVPTPDDKAPAPPAEKPAEPETTPATPDTTTPPAEKPAEPK